MVGDPVARQVANMRTQWPWVAARGDGARTLELPGALATVVPDVPHRSIFNSVIYDDADALETTYPELAAAYEEAGVIAWTVWIPDGDQRSRNLVESAGHVLDATPSAMEADLGTMDLPEAGDLDWTSETAMEDVYRINDLAYGMDDAPFQKAGVPDAGEAVLYAARADGEIASVLAVLDVDGDACVSVVGTLPQTRGRGLAGRLLACALRDARERGMTGTSLQATAAGEPLYLRLGYTIPFRFGMWERRKPQG